MARSPLVGEFKEYLEKFAPPVLAEEWDNVGLQVGSLGDRVSGVLVSLDVTEAVLWEAVEHNVNLIVTHHPLFFKSVRRLDDSQISTRLARLAVQMDLNILSFHTNLDATRQGLNDLLAKKLNLKNLKPLIPSKGGGPRGAGLGRVGRVRKTNLGAFLKMVSKRIGTKELRYTGDTIHPVSTVAVMTGSGGGFFLEAKEAGADVLITGDVKYHHALDALGEGIALVDIGHYRGEIHMVDLVTKKIRTWLKGKKSSLKVFGTRAQADPIQYWRG